MPETHGTSGAVGEAKGTGGLDPDLGLLRTFAVAARAASLTEAAARLGLSQPGLSRRISRLERSVGAVLLDRSRGALRPTPEGELLLRSADRVLADLDAVVGRLVARRHSLTGEVRIHASTIPAEHLLPALIAPFLARNPEVGVRMEVSRSAQVVAEVARGAVDLGVCGDRIDEPSVELRPLLRDVLVLAVPLDHPLAGRRSVRMDDLVGLDLLSREPGSGTLHAGESLFPGAGPLRTGPAPARVFGSSQSVLAAVRSGIGVALVSRLAVTSALDLRAVPVEGAEGERWFWLATRRNAPLGAAALAVIDHLRSSLTRTPPRPVRTSG